MRFLIDECLHESLVEVAHSAGFEATHVNHLGLSGKPDWELAARIIKDELTFVTNNRVDFVRLFEKMELHAGLIVIVPNVVPAVQRALFEATIQYLGGRDMINSAIELTLHGDAVLCVEYPLPKGWAILPHRPLRLPPNRPPKTQHIPVVIRDLERPQPIVRIAQLPMHRHTPRNELRVQ